MHRSERPFDFAISRESALLGLRENQLAIGDNIELPRLVGLYPHVHAEAGLE
jgi:hypothetical protein